MNHYRNDFDLDYHTWSSFDLVSAVLIGLLVLFGIGWLIYLLARGGLL